MKTELSVYLDAVRIGAALVVFLGHASGPLTQGFLWQLGPYLDAAVMVFFVLSGYVIAYVSENKELTLSEYTIARIARLSSVVIPAIVLTFFADFIGILINPSLYFDGPWPPPNINVESYLLSLFLIQNVWNLDMNPGINSPFWSLTFELMFYAFFGCYHYLKGPQKNLVLFLLALFAGPDILALFPIWLLGCLAYKLHKLNFFDPQNQWHSIPLASVCFISLLAFILVVPVAGKVIRIEAPFLINQRNFLADYISGTIFFVHLVTILHALKWFGSLLTYFKRTITLMGSMTFSLYLFHRPLIQLFAAFSEDRGSLESRVLVIGGTLLVVTTLGFWCEANKRVIKAKIQSLYKRLKHSN